MLQNLFARNAVLKTPAAPLILQAPLLSVPGFEHFVKGIDDVHIDVHLSPYFMEFSRLLIRDMLIERSLHHRRFDDSPSAEICERLEKFCADYAGMLAAAIQCARLNNNLVQVQLLEVAVIRFLLESVDQRAEQLLQELRNSLLVQGDSPRALLLYERTVWLSQHQNTLQSKVLADLFRQLHRAKKSEGYHLHHSLSAGHCSLPADLLFNRVLCSPDVSDPVLLMEHYVLLSSDENSPVSLRNLQTWLDDLLNAAADQCQYVIEADALLLPCGGQLSWRDVPENIDRLFTHSAARNLLLLRLKPLLLRIFAAYETACLYQHYARLLKPHLLVQALLGQSNSQDIRNKLQTELEARDALRSNDTDSVLDTSALIKAKQHLQRDCQSPPVNKLLKFVRDLVCYQRDLKYHHLLHWAMAQITLLQTTDEIQLSLTNGLLNEFPAQDEYDAVPARISGHTILKMNLCGLETVASELLQRGLNPSTHFSLNVFNPIKQLAEACGAEHIFIDGNTVVIALFEYANQADDRLTVINACQLAQQLMAVITAHNNICNQRQLPLLEVGIGLCYLAAAPCFVYAADQRILISPALREADQHATCDICLHQQYTPLKLAANVMIFWQVNHAHDKQSQNKPRLCYNHNGVALSIDAFEKLKRETDLQHSSTALLSELGTTGFYRIAPDTDEQPPLIIREAAMLRWPTDMDALVPDNMMYYELMSNTQVIDAVLSDMGYTAKELSQAKTPSRAVG